MATHPGWSGIIASILLSLGVLQFVQDYFEQAQNWLVQNLLHTAWVQSQASGSPMRPWPWADDWPLARLTMPSLETEQVILANMGDSGAEFAPSHLRTSVLPGEQGNSVLTVPAPGYKNFLSHLQMGDTLVLESMMSGRWHYRIVNMHVVEKTDTAPLLPSSNRQLTLVSCYPCTSHSNEALRYVVIAEEMEP